MKREVCVVLIPWLLLGALNGVAETTNAASSGLAAYQVKTGPVQLAQVEDNASGITYNPDTKTLFVVQNKPTQLVELDKQGKTLRFIPLVGFDDTEDVFYMGGGRFAVVEERRRNVCIFSLDSATTSVSYEKATRLLIDPVDADNSGLEGITGDMKAGRMFVVKEKTPRRIYEFATPSAEKPKPEITQPWDAEAGLKGATDISAVYFHPPSGNLLLLSDESACIVECTMDGKEVARLPLKAGSAGLQTSLKQPEGLTLDEEGNLYVCCEPNLFYAFVRK
jgi:uncharacterized protein YjiK